MTYWLKEDQNSNQPVKSISSEEDRAKSLKLLKYDLVNFQRVHPELKARATAEAFCRKWQGYSKTYGEDYVLNMINAVSGY